MRSKDMHAIQHPHEYVMCTNIILQNQAAFFTDLIEAETVGVIDLLDEECKLPKGSSKHFTNTVHSKYRHHPRHDVSQLCLCQPVHSALFLLTFCLRLCQCLCLVY